MFQKTDNHNPNAKLTLRRHFLRRYHMDGNARVMDCFAGSGKIWTPLKKEFKLAGYWEIDVKQKLGRVKIDSQRILDQPGWVEDVIDLDCYGLPWPHFLSMLKNCQHDLTVFLTIGIVKIGGSRLSREARKILGVDSFDLPNALAAFLNEFATEIFIAAPLDYGFKIIEAMEAPNPGGSALYIGLRLKKIVEKNWKKS